MAYVFALIVVAYNLIWVYNQNRFNRISMRSRFFVHSKNLKVDGFDVDLYCGYSIRRKLTLAPNRYRVAHYFVSRDQYKRGGCGIVEILTEEALNSHYEADLSARIVGKELKSLFILDKPFRRPLALVN